MTQAIQDNYSERFAHCYGCGPANPHGMHIKSYFDGDGTIARYTPDPAHSGGVPDHVYGGLIASLLDCHGTASAAAFAHRAQGRSVGDGQELPRFVTGTLTVEYRKPTPIDVELTVRGRLKAHDGRKITVALELTARDEVCARGEMIAIEIPPRL